MTTSTQTATFISTPTFDREGTLQTMSDYHKDAYGFRPRGINYATWSNEELEAECSEFGRICAENEIEQVKGFAINAAEHEAVIQKAIEHGASDRRNAIKWLYEASDCAKPSDDWFYGSQSLNQYVYNIGLLCSPQGDEISKELFAIYMPNTPWSRYS